MTDPLHIVCPACQAKNRVPATRLDARPTCGACKAALFPGVPFELDEAKLAKHLEGDDVPLLVDFWAPWCAPCRSMAPMFAQAAAQMSPNVRFAKLDTEQHQNVGARFQIRGIPLIILFDKGREVARQAGAMDAGQIVNWVSQHVKS
ncbi:thioredoxin TrxC [Hoeflea sp. YIM 152468]|uniref:thioredoxin TrxC n=1 Tax=Hoeflea sp. YIM 152468 TaxID=3031759 RepID=UPI0023D9BBA7|nr:thioredoxin TrxC [Hoeflea sp. YIM 152468]MDF1607407.1 thioredoxin TrxC [Hoeflea sp. YIM 152468]